MANKSSLDNILKEVLSVANAEQNSAYPPHIFERHYNIVTSFLLDAGAQIYPDKVDVFLPVIKSKQVAVKDGTVTLPDDYRNLLGAPSIQANKDGKDCSDPIIIDTEREFKTSKLKAGCKSYFIEIVDKKTWDDRTTSSYGSPTYKTPIGMFVGDRKIKVCPYDLSYVQITYFKQEKIYRYGYIMQPDDTFIFNAATSEETEWETAAAKYLFKGCLALYSAYSRDPSLTEYSTILNKLGLF